MNTFPAASTCSANTALQMLCFKKCHFSLILIPISPTTCNSLHIHALWTPSVKRAGANACFLRPSVPRLGEIQQRRTVLCMAVPVGCTRVSDSSLSVAGVPCGSTALASGEKQPGEVLRLQGPAHTRRWKARKRRKE